MLLKYQKLWLKLKSNVESGKFYEWSRQKRQYLIARLLHYASLLRKQGFKIGASIAFVSSLLFVNPSIAQDCVDGEVTNVQINESFSIFPLQGILTETEMKT